MNETTSLSASKMDLLYDDEHVQLLYRPGSTPYTLATFSNYGFAVTGRTFWGKALCDAENIDAFGFVAKTNNWFPQISLENLLRDNVFRPKHPVITYGHSQGGYAALKYSSRLNAAGVVAGAPQYSINPQMTGDDRRFANHYVRALHQEMEIKEQDIGGNLVVVYDPNEPSDNFHYGKISELLPPERSFRAPVYNVGHSIMEVLQHRHVVLGLFEVALTGKGLPQVLGFARAAKKRSSFYASCLAERILRDNKPKLALAVLDRVLQKNNGYLSPLHAPMINLVRSKAYKEAGMIADATVYAEKAALDRPKDTRFLLHFAECLLASGDSDRALHVYHDAIQATPAGSPAQLGLIKTVDQLLSRAANLSHADRNVELI